MPDSTTFSILFFTRKIKTRSEVLSIYARITVDGKCSEFSLKRRISVNSWEPSKNRVKKNTPNSAELNSYLDQVYNRLLSIHKSLIERDYPLTAKAVKDHYLGLAGDYKTLDDIVEYHNTQMTGILKAGTLKNYYTTARYLKLFLKSTWEVEDIFLKKIDYSFIVAFENYLRTYKPVRKRKTCGHNGTMKHLERLQKLLNLAVKLEWIDKTPFRNYQLKFQKFERSYLNERELRLIEGTFFKDKSLERVKDIFLFSCYTGISYVDLFNLNKAAVVEGSNSKQWVYLNRQKTGQKVKIPLLNKAQKILEKYWDFPANDSNKALPVPCNQNINKKLKEIVKGAGIGKTVTFHSARHTFATTVTLSNGVPIETVSKLLGHTKLSTTQIYARVLEEKIGQEMEILNEKISSSEKKPGAYCRKGKSYRTRI